MVSCGPYPFFAFEFPSASTFAEKWSEFEPKYQGLDRLPFEFIGEKAISI